MDAIILGLCKILDTILNPAIILMAGIEIYFLAVNIQKLGALRNHVEKLNANPSVKYNYSRHEDKKIMKEGFVTVEKDWAELEKIREEYKDADKYYTWFASLIQVFPLLGILGTVAGLYISFQQDIVNIYEGVEFALSSTVWGLFFAVIFKVCDTFLRAKYVNGIEEGVDRFEKGYMADSERSK